MIRSSKHTLKFANEIKKDAIGIFVDDYRSTLQQIVDFLWQTDIRVYDKKDKLANHLNVEENKLKCPSMLDNALLKQFQTPVFTQRMLQCVGKQACSMVKAAVEQRRKQLFMLKKLQKQGKSIKFLNRKIRKQELVKPHAAFANPVLDSRFLDFEQNAANGGSFDMFVQIRLGDKNNVVRIPVKHTKVSRRWEEKGTMKQSVFLSKNNIYLVYDAVPQAQVESGRVIGIDQGITTCLALSDGQQTVMCVHDHDLASICKRLTKCKKGGKGFASGVAHRKNYINWAINQLDLTGVKEIRFEKLRDVRRGKRMSNFQNRWTYTLIKEKLERLCEELGIKFTEVPNKFNSQRCSKCGLVCKRSRQGKIFVCVACGFTADADTNASCNVEDDRLNEVPFWVQPLKLHYGAGFYWLPAGIFHRTGEPIVPLTNSS